MESVFVIPFYGTNNYVPCKLNPVQLEFLYGMVDRNIVEKSRKHGMSTLVLMILIINANEFPDSHWAFIANSDVNTLGIFEKAQSLVEKARYKFNCTIIKRDITWVNGSWLKIATAGAKSAFRGGDLHGGHFSELAFFEYPDVYSAAIEASPKETFWVLESTANGRNLFYDMWVASENYPEKTAFKPFFFPWFRHPDNIRDVPDDFVLTPDEKLMKEEYKLTNQQLAWYRWKPTSNIEFVLEPRKFFQEHPTTPEEAFMVSGRNVFNQKMLARMKKVSDNYRLGSFELNKENKVQFFDSDKHTVNWIRFFKGPEMGIQYVIGADVAEGRAGGDYNAAVVFDANTKTQVCEFHAICDPDQFAFRLNQMGRYYNNALLIVERNGPGHSVNSMLHSHYNYPRVYMEDITDSTMSTEITDSLGFRTNKTTKEQLIAESKRAIRLGITKLNSALLLNECLAYEYNEHGQAGAPKGKHDDLVMAFMLANHVMTSEMYAEVAEKYFEEEGQSSYFGLIEPPPKHPQRRLSGY